MDDQVKYMAVIKDTFYPNLQEKRELRSSMAATGIYSQADLQQFGLELLSDDELKELGVPQEARGLIGTPADVPGYKSGIYLDYVAHSYILAFAEQTMLTMLSQTCGRQQAGLTYNTLPR